jgi:hypothetical protein
MVIRLVAIPDTLYLTDFDAIFHAVLGRDSGIGYAFQIQGQECNSFQRKNRSKKIRDLGLHRQEKFLYTLGALDQWEWEFRVIDLQDGAEGTIRRCALVDEARRHRSIPGARPDID